MKWIITGLVLAGLVAAFSASALTAALRFEATGAQPAALPDTRRDATIVVAGRDLGALTVLSAGDAVLKMVPEDEVPEGAITSAAEAVGRLLSMPIAAGRPLLAASFAGDETGRHLAATLPAGTRAISIPVGEETGLEGLLYPGCMVDVVASFRIPRPDGATTEIVSATVLQGVQVLAIGNRTVVSNDPGAPADPRDTRRRTVTLLVDSKQAEALQLAMTQGTIALAMRNPLDTAVGNGTGVTMSDLSEELAQRLAALASAAQPEPAPPAPTLPVTVQAETRAPPRPAERPVWKTVVYRGNAVQEVTFPQPAETDSGEDDR